MPGLESIAQHAIPFLLVLFRLAGLFIAAPLLSSSMIPARVKALFVLMLAAALYPAIPPQHVETAGMDLFSLAPLMITEGLLGLAIGTIASIPLISLEIAGVVMGQQIGFGLARVYNPELEMDTDLLGQMLFYLGSGAFIAMGGLETLFTTVAATFGRVPVGGFGFAHPPIDLLIGVIASGFELAIRVAAPVTGSVLLIVVSFGVMSKTMPALNVMTVGFTAKILAALAMIAFAAYAIEHAVGTEIEHTIGAIITWTESLSPASGS